MKKTYKTLTVRKPSMPRNGSNNAVSRVSGGALVISASGGGTQRQCDCDGHYHDNLSELNRLGIDDGYVTVRSTSEDGDGYIVDKSKAGYADNAGHADKAFDLDEDSPVREQFLSRIADDVAAGRIRFVKGLRSEGVSEFEREATFEDGAQFGASFAEGVTGFGGKIDSRGDAWLGGLHLRNFLEVPELRYNREEISIGNSWRAPGGGIIEKVMPDYNDDGTPADTGTVTLRLEDGEIGAVAVGDLCQGIFHDEINPSNNATADSDDGRGNFHFAGFCSVYFKITNIKEKGRNSVFEYRLRELSERWRWQHHPSAQMHFVAYGSVTYEDRKTSRYATRTYERYLVNVNGWELTSKNIAAQFGDLSNLSLFGLQMSGYSAYLNNIYMTGRIEQLDLSPRMELKYDNDNFIAPGQTKSVRCRVLRGFEDVTGAVTKWSVTRASDSAVDTLTWLQKDKVQNFAGEIEIAYDDLLGAADAGTTFTFMAETDGKTATASITLRRNPLNGEDGKDGTDYTNNLLRNSDFADGFDGWTASSIVELDAAMSLDGRVSALIAASGLDANKYYGLSSLLEYTGAPVDMTFSLSARTDDRMSFKDNPEDENLSRYPYMEIRCLNADKTRLKTIAANVLPSAVDEWQRISVSGQTEEGTRWIEVAVYIPRNGRLWVNGAKLEFGDNPATVWTPYAKGLDAYTVMLSSESHVFEGDTEKAVEASTECVVTAYKGTVARPVTIGAVTGAPSGMIVVRADNNTVSAKIKVSVTPTLTTRQGVLRIPVTVDGIIFEKSLSWTLALKGDEGIQGCLYRVTQWAAERDFRNDSAEKTDGLRYVDVVIIPDYSLKTKGRAYRCVATHQSTGENAPGTDGGKEVWEELNEMAPIYTPLLLADNAVITLLQSNQVIVMKDDGTTVNAALGAGKYPLWIGAADPEEANFKVDDEGKASMTGAEVSGKVTAGIANGQRVELQPDNKAMKIYDEDGAEASSFEGNRYTGTDRLFGSKSDTLGIINGRGVRTLKFTGAGMESGSVTDTLHDNIFVSDSIETDTPVEVLVTGYLYTTFTKTTVGGSIIGPVDPDFPDGSGGSDLVKPGDSEIIGPVPVTNASADVKLYLDTYSDAGLTDMIGSQEVASCNKRDEGVEFTRKSVKTTTGGHHVLRLSISIHATGSGAEGTVKWGSAVGGKPDISGSYTSDFYVSRYFANGFCLGTSERDYIMAYDQGEKGMRLVFENNGYGLEASDAGLRHRHHNGNWLGMPLLVFKGVYEYTAAYGYRARTTATKSCNGVAPAVSRRAQGHIRLTYPSGWPALSLDNAIVNVTGYGTVAEGGGSPVKANIREITSDYIDITLSDDQSLNDGAFMIDISLIE